MNINLQQLRVSIDQSKLCTQIYLQIIASCINLQLPIINFQQIRVSGSVKTVLINIFANNDKLHKFAATNNNFEKKNSDMHHHETYM